MYELPTNIELGGVQFHIRNDGDYRMVLDAFSALNDPELTESEKVMSAMIIFYDGMEEIDDLYALGDLEEAAKAMFNWMDADRPKSTTNNVKLLDWQGDSAMICASINKVAGFEIRSKEYVHWWTFMGYFMGIGEGTFATVVSIRDKIIKGKKMEKWEQEFRRDNPQYFNWQTSKEEDDFAEEWFNSVWNKE